MKLVDVALLVALFTLLSFLWGVGDGTIAANKIGTVKECGK